MTETRTLMVKVEFDPKWTYAEAVGYALDKVLREAVGNGLFEECGPVEFLPSAVVSRPTYVDLEGHVRYRDG